MFFYSCQNSGQELEISKIPVETKLIRFDQAFAGIESPSDLQDLKMEYPMFFPAQVPDSTWFNLSKSETQVYIQSKVDSVFSSEESLKKDFESLFQHLLFYKPQFQIPDVYFLVGDGDAENKTLVYDNMLLVSLDFYLGKDQELYYEVPSYLAYEFQSKFLIRDAALALWPSPYYRGGSLRNFLDRMIEEGKGIYLLEQLIPTMDLGDNLSYSAEDLQWSQENEFQVWSYFSQNDYLFSSEGDLSKRFIDTAPFSKFFMDFDRETPPRIGRYIGYRIVDSFMQNNDVSLPQLLEMAPNLIYQRSKYKPRKQKKMAVVHKSKIEIVVGLDENKVPEKLAWSAQDGGIKNEASKAIMISVWDHLAQDTLRMDLWTKDMPVDEMKQFFHQTLVSMASTFERATDDEKMTATMRDFCDYFAEKLELNKK
jgi:gliding motility-associated protein GldC